jgi:uncharacterized RmlC-like cupin family protein
MSARPNTPLVAFLHLLLGGSGVATSILAGLNFHGASKAAGVIGGLGAIALAVLGWATHTRWGRSLAHTVEVDASPLLGDIPPQVRSLIDQAAVNAVNALPVSTRTTIEDVRPLVMQALGDVAAAAKADPTEGQAA